MRWVPSVIACRLGVVTVVGGASLLSPTPAVATSGSKQLAAVATRDFGRLLHHRYGSFKGYWTCPVGQLFGSQILCQAEFKKGRRWHSVSANADVRGAQVGFSHVNGVSWIRTWSPYTAKVLSGFQTPGTASVNTKYEDWAFVGAGAYYDWSRHLKSAVVNGYDGPGPGLERFTMFHCRITVTQVACTNSFGDSIRYLPGG